MTEKTVTLPFIAGNYEVSIDPTLEFDFQTKFIGGYVIKNLTTGIIEAATPSLVEALCMACRQNHYMTVDRPWEKVGEPTPFDLFLQQHAAEAEGPTEAFANELAN